MRSLSLIVSALLLAACGGSSDPVDSGVTVDAGSDAARTDDAGAPDAGAEPDAGLEPDAGIELDAGPTCTTGQVEGVLDGLLYLSESEFPISITIHPGEGSAAPTVADVRRLSGASASATDETRTEEWFWMNVEVDPTRDPAIDPDRPAMLRAAFEALATDRIVVRILPPGAGTAENPVLVYVAGRTACGDLVWLSTAAVGA